MYALVFSDSHGAPQYINEVLLRQLSAPDAVIFLGDGLRDLEYCDTGDAPIYSVRGNCDLGAFYEDEEQMIELCGVRIFIAHGHRYSVKSGYTVIAEKAARRGADIVMFGHTHIPLCLTFSAGDRIGDTVLEKALRVFNPGSMREGYFGTLTVIRGEPLLSNSEL